MKLITCKQLGGSCEKTFAAETFEEISELSKDHGMKMFKENDKDHLEAMSKMKDLMENPEEMAKWMDEKKKEFEDSKECVKVEVEINKPIDLVWESWTKPNHITNWNFASEDWECPKAENNLEEGKKFKINMSAKDKSASFDFEGTYTIIQENKLIGYVLDDGRKVKIEFNKDSNKTKLTEVFELESENSKDLQKQGWQSILENFKKYTENL